MHKLDGKITSVSLNGTKAKDSVECDKVIITDVKLPSDAPARMKTLKAGGKKWYVTIVFLPDSEKPYAMFCTTNQREGAVQTNDAVQALLQLASTKGILQEHISSLEERMTKSGTSNVDRLTRSLSLLLRHNVGIPSIVATLDSLEGIYVGSFLFQIKKFLSSYIKDGQKVEGGTCTECGSTNLIYSEGCMSCADCGSSKCS